MKTMSRKSLVTLLVLVGFVVGVVVWMHMGGGGALRSWMMAIHGKH
jgi:nitrate/TMAO reductase-like tetraheme cytochrome c subunit